MARRHSVYCVLICAFAAAVGCKTTGNQAKTLAAGEVIADRSEEIHQKVLGALRDKVGGEENATWADTGALLQGDWIIPTTNTVWGTKPEDLPKSNPCTTEATCYAEFGRLKCSSDSDCHDTGMKCEAFRATVAKEGDEPQKLCRYPSDPFVDRVYDTMAQAKERLDIVSLSAPQGIFHKAMINALTLLSHRNASTQVRMLYSGEASDKLNILQPPQNYLDRVVQDLKDKGAEMDKLTLNAGWLSNHFVLSWNHTKAIIADQKIVLQGGHNLWDPDYVGMHPVSDISMIAQGSAVVATEKFVDILWSNITIPANCFIPYPPTYATYPQKCSKIGDFAADKIPPAASGETKTITVGRLGAFGNAQSSEAGQVALMDSATKELLIAQQDIYNLSTAEMGPIDLAKDTVLGLVGASFALNSISAAVIRGVKLTVIQSNAGTDPAHDYGTVSATNAYTALVRKLKNDMADQHFVPADGSSIDDYICSHVAYTPLRYSLYWDLWPDSNDKAKYTVANHTKVVIADRSAFYLGSHNLYPSTLQEFGMIVFDAGRTKELMTQFWDKAWTASERVKEACK